MYNSFTSNKRYVLSVVIIASLSLGVFFSAPVQQASAETQEMSQIEMFEMITQLMAMIAALQAQLDSQINDPIVVDTIINVGDTVRTTDNLSIRVTPGGVRIGTALAGTEGEVVDGPQSLDGRTWWKVAYDIGQTGWSAADWLQAVSQTPTPIPDPGTDGEIDVVMISSDASSVEDNSGVDTGKFEIEFDVTAIDEDFHIVRTPQFVGDPGKDGHVMYDIVNGSSRTSLELEDVEGLSATIDSNAELDTFYDRYVVEEGETETFTLQVSFVPKPSTGIYGINLYEYFNYVSPKGKGGQVIIDEDDFATNMIYLEGAGGEYEENIVRIETSSKDPDSTTILLKEDDDTETTVFVFEIDADDSEEDVTVEEIGVWVDFDDGTEVSVEEMKLLVGSQTFSHNRIEDESDDEALFIFEIDGDLVVKSGEVEDVEVEATFSSVSSDFESVEVDFSASAGDLKSSADEDYGSARSEEHTLVYGDGLMDVEIVSTDTDQDDTVGVFEIVFEVTALDDDVYLDDIVSSGKTGEIDYTYWSDADGSADVTHSLSSTADEEDGDYVVEEGETETFTLTVNIEPDQSGLHYVRLAKVGSWEGSTSEFKTDKLYINGRDAGTPTVRASVDGDKSEYVSGEDTVTIDYIIENAPEGSSMQMTLLNGVGGDDHPVLSRFRLEEGSRTINLWESIDYSTFRLPTEGTLVWKPSFYEGLLPIDGPLVMEVYDADGDQIVRVADDMSIVSAEPEDEPPYENAFSCGRDGNDRYDEGEVACYGVWDYGNSFGGDQDMCGAYSDYDLGCVVDAPVCDSGLAEAANHYSNRELEGLSSPKISTISERLGTTDEMVREEMAGMWEYSCISDQDPDVDETQLHVVGVYQAAGASHSFCGSDWGEIDVTLDSSLGNGSISLVLSSYEPVEWSITNQAEVEIDEIYLTGYNPQRVTGAGGADVSRNTYYKKNSYTQGGDSGQGAFYDATDSWPAHIYHWASYCDDSASVDPDNRRYLKGNSGYVTGYSSSNNSALLSKAEDWTGLDVNSFQGTYSGSQFTVSSNNGNVLGASTSSNYEMMQMILDIQAILDSM